MQDKDILVSLSQVRAALGVVQITGPGSVPAGTWSVLTGAVLDELRDMFKQPGMQRVRPSLVAFVLVMEEKMRRGDVRRPAWDTAAEGYVLGHLLEELAEFREAMAAGTPEDITKEAADVANCMHILADKRNGCPYGGRGQGK